MEQPQYNMLARERVEKDYVLLYEHYGTGLTIFSPLRCGILTGKYNDGIPEDSRLATSKDGWSTSMSKRIGDDSWKKDIEKIRKLKVGDFTFLAYLQSLHSTQPIADKLGCDQAALALGWVLKNPNVSSAITGASKVEQIHKSVKALDIVPKLTDDIMKEIDEVLENKPAPLTRRF